MSKILNIDAGDYRQPETPAPAAPAAVALPAGLREIERRLIAEHAPPGPTEEILVRQLATLAWRLERMPAYEAAWMHVLETGAESGIDAWTEINRLWRHQSAFLNQFQKALRELQKLQANRMESSPAALAEPPGVPKPAEPAFRDTAEVPLAARTGPPAHFTPQVVNDAAIARVEAQRSGTVTVP